MTPAERTRLRATLLADRLRAEGRTHDAGIVSALVKSSATSTVVNSQLWRDNQDLRARLEQAERESAAR